MTIFAHRSIVGGCTGRLVVRRGKIIVLFYDFWSRENIDRILHRSSTNNGSGRLTGLQTLSAAF